MAGSGVGEWGLDTGGKGRGWGARPRGAACARVPSWEMQLGINSVCFIISLQAVLGEATSRGGRATGVSLGYSSARLEWGEGDGGEGALGITGREIGSLNQGNRKTVPPPLPAGSSSDSVYPREGIAPPRKEGGPGPTVLGEDPFLAFPQVLIFSFHSPSRSPPLLSPLLTAATEKEERKPRAIPVSSGYGLVLSAT